MYVGMYVQKWQWEIWYYGHTYLPVTYVDTLIVTSNNYSTMHYVHVHKYIHVCKIISTYMLYHKYVRIIYIVLYMRTYVCT